MKKLLACALATVLFCAPAPARSAEFSDQQFCADSNAAEQELNAKGPQWVDAVTRADGMAVDCTAHTIDYKKFIKLKAADMQQGWEAQMQQAWDQYYCGDEAIHTAISNGWTVSVSLTFADNATLPVTVDCGH